MACDMSATGNVVPLDGDSRDRQGAVQRRPEDGEGGKAKESKEAKSHGS